MKWLLVALGLLVVAVVAFVVWRLWATVAGGNRAYAALTARIQPVLLRLEAGEAPAAEDLERFAADRATRKVLHEALEHHDKLALFPSRYLTQEAMAEADLSAWLNHPNELGAIPDEIEMTGAVPVRGGTFDGRRYYLFRYRMHPPHWAAKDGWLAGVAGPYPDQGPVLASAPGTFSRFEAYDSRSPDDHVQTTHELVVERRPSTAPTP
jgi:hypothetical protein